MAAVRPAPLTLCVSRFTLQLRNRQRDRRLNLRFLRRVLRHVLTEQLRVPAAELCFHFVSAAEMARVNWQFLQHEGSTDVITFDHALTHHAPRTTPAALHGEAYICVADAVKQAREFQTTWQSEVIRYAVHALLHLQGYDDLQPAQRRVMKREENRLMRGLAKVFDLAQLETPNSKL
jgi:probable rRNA maturation factor